MSWSSTAKCQGPEEDDEAEGKGNDQQAPPSFHDLALSSIVKVYLFIFSRRNRGSIRKCHRPPFPGHRADFYLCVLSIPDRTYLFGFIFGFLFDIYYTEINGIYLVLLPFVVVLTHQMMKVLHNNIFVLGIIAVVNLSILEVIVYYIYVILKRTNLTFMEFVDWRLWPTLVLNVVFYLIVSIPFKHYLVSRRKAWLGE